MSQLKSKKWWNAAGTRAIKTLAQTAIATIGTAVILQDADWKTILFCVHSGRCAVPDDITRRVARGEGVRIMDNTVIAVVDVAALNIRDEPDGEIVGIAQRGDEFYLAPDQPDDSDWLKVYQGSPEQAGYVMSQYVTLCESPKEPAKDESEGCGRRNRKK